MMTSPVQNKENFSMRLPWVPAVILSFLACLGATASDHLLVCGRADVMEGIIETSGGRGVFKTVWRWSAEKDTAIPRELVSKFATTDDCKPVSEGKEVLITSSGGAATLVSRSSGKALFYTHAANAHSADLLPDGLIAVALSTSRKGDGDRIALFHRSKPDQALDSFPLPSAHGAVWDSKRKVLWTLGFDELQQVTIEGAATATPRLHVEKRWKLPATGGHDLQLLPDGSKLSVTNTTAAYLFDPAAGTFSEFPVLSAKRDVKSISVHPRSGRIAFTVADEPNWWTYTLRFLKPDQEVRMPDYIYKVRWYPQAKD